MQRGPTIEHGMARRRSRRLAPEQELVPIFVPRWAWAGAALALMVLYIVGFENGALLGPAAEYVHEGFHNIRHFAAFPCH